MKLIATIATVLCLGVSVSAAQAGDPVYDGVYDFCPNLDWAYSPYDAWVKSGDLYESKWSNHYGTYICVRSH